MKEIILLIGIVMIMLAGCQEEKECNALCWDGSIIDCEDKCPPSNRCSDDLIVGIFEDCPTDEIEEQIGIGTTKEQSELYLKDVIKEFPDYSKGGYIQGAPNNDTRVIIIECVNSTLVINDTMLYCEN